MSRALIILRVSSTLFNGKGRSVKDLTAPLAKINVEHGQRYRFRLISLACEPNFTFSIDGHNMTIIEADGVETNPLTVDSFMIFPGQRYSFVLTADQPVDNYCESERDIFDSGLV